VGNVVGNKLQAARNSLEHLITERRNAFRTSLLVAFALAYNAYFIAGDQYNSICRMYSTACSLSDHVVCAGPTNRFLNKKYSPRDTIPFSSLYARKSSLLLHM
jgi:hypothetical protein